MTNTEHTGQRILGRLRSEGGTGVVTVQDRFDTDIDDLWSAITDPARIARWLGEVEGDLRLGGEFRAHFSLASGWEGTDAGWRRASRRGGCWCGPWTTPSRKSSSSRPR